MGVFKLPSILTADRTPLVLAERELVYDTDLNQVFAGDGTTAGGVALSGGGGATDLGYTASTRLLTSSTGLDVTLPLATTSDAGLISSADKTKLDGITGTNTGDQTSIVGITGTKAQFDTAVTDGNIMYVGDPPTAHTHLLSAVTDVTMTVANLNSLDDGVDSTLHFHAADRARANHTGTQAVGTITGLAAVATSGSATDLTVGTLPNARLAAFGSGDVSFAAGGGVGTIAAGAVTNSKLVNIASALIKGRITAGSGNVEDLTGAQVKTILAITTADISNFAAGVRGVPGYATTATSGGTTTLTAASADIQVFTGALAQTLVLPDVTTLTLGRGFTIVNEAIAGITVQSSGLNSFTTTLQEGQTATLTCVALTGTGVASWVMRFVGARGRTGLGNLAVFNRGPTFRDTPIFTASDATFASLRVLHGIAPTTPTDGDVWTTTAGMFVRVNGTTVGPLSTGGGSPITVQDEGSNITTALGTLNFVGAGVTVTGGATATVTIPGGSGSPGGASGEIQWNNSGAFAGAADVEIEGGQLRLPAIALPTVPAAGGLKLFARDVGGRILPSTLGPSGLDSPLQPHLGLNRHAWSIPVGNATTVNTMGIALTGAGTATAKNWASTNRYTKMRGLEYLITTAATNALVGFRGGAAQFTVGSNAAEDGGFHFVCRWGPATGVATTTSRAFVGMSTSTGAGTDVDPSSRTGQVGMGWDAADTNVQFMHNDASGISTKIDLGAAFPVPTVDRQEVYEIAMFSPPGTTQSVSYRVRNLRTGAAASGTVTTDLPSTTTALNPYSAFSVGGTLSVIGICLFSLYVETDY